MGGGGIKKCVPILIVSIHADDIGPARSNWASGVDRADGIDARCLRISFCGLYACIMCTPLAFVLITMYGLINASTHNLIVEASVYA